MQKNCKYEQCGKPFEAIGFRRYCTDACYQKQNKIDQAKNREKRRLEKKGKYVEVVCAYDLCDKVFQKKWSRSAYCCIAHRDEQKLINDKEKRVEHSTAPKQKGALNPMFTKRGKIHYHGYTTI